MGTGIVHLHIISILLVSLKISWHLSYSNKNNFGEQILDCVIESEFDVRILDEGVLKLFRLAQLAVEYQQFCRHYLDRSVYVLREEITSLAQVDNYIKRHI